MFFSLSHSFVNPQRSSQGQQEDETGLWESSSLSASAFGSVFREGGELGSYLDACVYPVLLALRTPAQTASALYNNKDAGT